jgi:hypothetical protein
MISRADRIGSWNSTLQENEGWSTRGPCSSHGKSSFLPSLGLTIKADRSAAEKGEEIFTAEDAGEDARAQKAMTSD